MRREDVTELQYITDLRNLPSIIQLGLLSYEKASRITHHSVAMDEIQTIHTGKTVPGGRPLHQYANLYFSARNPMMYKRKDQHRNICVLRIDSSVLDLPKAIVCNGNAASQYTWFRPVNTGLAHLDAELIFSRDWRHPDIRVYYQQRSAKCAELLIPDKLDPSYITGIYVSCAENKDNLSKDYPDTPIMLEADMFFYKAPRR